MNYFEAVAKAAEKIDIQTISEDVYLGNATRYVIVSTETKPDAFSDDAPSIDRIYLTIGVYVPIEEKARAWERKFRTALENNMENVQKIGTVYEDKKRTRHIIFTAEMLAGREE